MENGLAMHQGHGALEILAHWLIAFLFLSRAIAAIRKFDDHAARIAARGVPFSKAALALGLAMMILGGGLMVLGWRSEVGAGVLLAFTAMATLLYHNFWDRTEAGARREEFRKFSYNLAVAGGLILLMV